MSFVDQVLSLINKTEANLRRIDAFGEDFAIPPLNEWRYAIRHVVTAAGKSGDAAQDWGKAIGHIKRAYFDSCDILLDCQLKVLIETNRRYRKPTEDIGDMPIRLQRFFQTIRSGLGQSAAHRNCTARRIWSLTIAKRPTTRSRP